MGNYAYNTRLTSAERISLAIIYVIVVIRLLFSAFLSVCVNDLRSYGIAKKSMVFLIDYKLVYRVRQRSSRSNYAALSMKQRLNSECVSLQLVYLLR